MKLLGLALPALSLRQTAVEPRQSASVRGVSYEFVSGDGCQGKSYGQFTSIDGNIITLIFDKYQVAIPATSAAPREQFCTFAVTFEFPTGCQTGTLISSLDGTATLPVGFSADFNPDFNANNGKLTVDKGSGNNLTTLIGGGSKAVDIFQDYLGEHSLTVKHDSTLQNQRNVTFKATSRVSLQGPSDKGSAAMSVDALSISIRNIKSC